MKMGKSAKWILSLAVILGLLLAAGPQATASDYPNKPVTLVIPYPAGGSTDVTGRALMNAAKKYFTQPIIVENKSGGGGTVGPNLVITKPPDGYTLGIMASATVTISWHMGKMNFNPIEDVTHIIRYTGYLYGLVVRADSPWKTIQDFVNHAKANPGKVSYGTPGVGTGVHLCMEEFASQAGMKLVHMPYKGGAETNAALLGGHVDAVSDSSGWSPLVDAGKFRLLAVYTAQRSAKYADAPTLKEAGYDVVFPSPLEFMGPKGLPKPIVQKIHDLVKKAMEDPEYQAVLKKFDMSNIYLNTEDLEKAVRQDSERISKMVKKVGLEKK
jgi:tripartite-type tricarboxylate transporter receptor subunit TctC